MDDAWEQTDEDAAGGGASGGATDWFNRTLLVERVAG